MSSARHHLPCIHQTSLWPKNKKLGLLVEVKDKTLPDTIYDMEEVYFADREEFDKWIIQQETWIKGTNHDFLLMGSLYAWNPTAPAYIESVTI